MFNASFGADASWLIPAALIALGAVVWLRWRSPHTDLRRASALVWGGWLVLTALLFSFAQGIIHPYYTVALAPAIGALVGMGGVALWRERHRIAARVVLAAGIVAAAAWSAILLGRTPDWLPWLQHLVLIGGLVAAGGVLGAAQLKRAALTGVVTLALVASLAGSVAYAIDTAVTPHSGAIPSAGPVTAAALQPGGALGGGPAGARGGAPFGAPNGAALNGAALNGRQPPGAFNRPPLGAPPRFGGGGPGGGLLSASTPSSALVSTLQQDASAYEWVAATIGANTAAGYELAADDAVMAIGGFNGTDPTPSLGQFEQLVGAHKIHYFIAPRGRGGTGPGPGPGAGSSASSEISTWVEQNFTSTTVGGTTVYDLTAPLGGASNDG
jgi:4-amino-4-deoxy-L-arabinose transferase-like glycosyltransferase